MSENLDEVEAVDGSVSDLDASKEEAPGDVNTETDSLSQPSTFGGIKLSSSDTDRLSNPIRLRQTSNHLGI